MGFFSNPLKATKAFFKDPIGKIDNDINKVINPQQHPPKQQECRDKCFDTHLAKPNNDFADKKQLDKMLLDQMAHQFCVKGCNKK